MWLYFYFNKFLFSKPIEFDGFKMFFNKQIYRFYRCATIELNLQQNEAIDESVVLLLHIKIILPVIEIGESNL